jgi:hypothetical protein
MTESHLDQHPGSAVRTLLQFGSLVLDVSYQRTYQFVVFRLKAYDIRAVYNNVV